MIRDSRLASEQEISRFQIEAKAAATLDHPGIVPVYEYGERDGCHLIAMGLVEGESLSDRIQQKMVDQELAVTWMRQLTEAVQCAHEHGIIHRDLKPANILIDSNDHLKITDFGLARLEVESGQTLSGQILGTPSYMAPEQAAGLNDRIAATTDVFSLGIIFFQLLTGRPPFSGATALETMSSILTDDPKPLREINPSVPIDLQAICLKCLNKDAKSRYQTAKALQDDLSRFERDEPVVARPTDTFLRVKKWLSQEQRIYDAAMMLVPVAMMLIVATVAMTLERHQRQQNLRSALNQVKLLVVRSLVVGDVKNAENRANFESALKSFEDHQAAYFLQKVPINAGVCILVSLMWIVLAIAILKDPGPALVNSWTLIVGIWLALIALPFMIAVFDGANVWEIYRSFVPSTLVLPLLGAMVSSTVILSLGNYSYYMNREKLAYRRLSLRVKDSSSVVWHSRRFHAAYAANALGAILILVPLLLYVLQEFYSSRFDLIDESWKFYGLLGSTLFAGLILEYVRWRSTVRQVAKSNDRWKIDTGLGAVIESREKPECYPTSLLEACLLQISLGWIGGRIKQHFPNAVYFVIRTRNKRLLMAPKDPHDFAKKMVK